MKAIDLTFDIDQLANHLGVRAKTVFDWVANGELKSLKGSDIIEFGNGHPEHKRICDALIGYYDCLLSMQVGPRKS